MKKVLIAVMLTGVSVSPVHAATEATATAVWQATAKKDSSSALVVTPLSNLAFQYSEGVKAFNEVNALFDVALKGDPNATDFTLKARQLSGNLIHASMPSVLEVGGIWQDRALFSDSYTTLIDSKKGLTGGPLSPLSAGFNDATKVSTAQDTIRFKVMKATVNGTDTPFDALPDGLWGGEVRVEFLANWS